MAMVHRMAVSATAVFTGGAGRKDGSTMPTPLVLHPICEVFIRIAIEGQYFILYCSNLDSNIWHSKPDKPQFRLLGESR